MEIVTSEMFYKRNHILILQFSHERIIQVTVVKKLSRLIICHKELALPRDVLILRMPPVMNGNQ